MAHRAGNRMFYTATCHNTIVKEGGVVHVAHPNHAHTDLKLELLSPTDSSAALSPQAHVAELGMWDPVCYVWVD